MTKTIFISFDALRADHLAQYGYYRETMPALDRLMDEGRLYSNAFSNGVHTKTSIPSFLTGQYDGFINFRERKTIAGRLSDAGIETYGLHSNVNIISLYGMIPGFDSYEDFSGKKTDTDVTINRSLLGRAYDYLFSTFREHLADSQAAQTLHDLVIPVQFRHTETPYVGAEQITDHFASWLNTEADNDFFAWVHYMDPHRPYGANYSDPYFLDRAVSQSEVAELLAKAGEQPENVTEPERQLLIDLYDSDLRYLSNHLDRLFDILQREGHWDDTQIILTADHGDEFAEHGMFYHRNRPYEELIHVPLIQRAPGVPAGEETATRSLVDLGSTVLRYHNIDVPKKLDGQPLANDDQRDVIVSRIHSQEQLDIGVRRDSWKLMHGESEDTVLFDLGADPAETQNIASDYPEQVEQLRSVIPATLRGTTDQLSERDELTQATKEQLEELGYLD